MVEAKGEKNSLWEIQRLRDQERRPHGRRALDLRSVLPPKLPPEEVFEEAAKLEQKFHEEIVDLTIRRTIRESP